MKLAVVSQPESGDLHVAERQPAAIELSVVIPCLNEAETLETCILNAQKAFLPVLDWAKTREENGESRA